MGSVCVSRSRGMEIDVTSKTSHSRYLSSYSVSPKKAPFSVFMMESMKAIIRVVSYVTSYP